MKNADVAHSSPVKQQHSTGKRERGALESEEGWLVDRVMNHAAYVCREIETHGKRVSRGGGAHPSFYTAQSTPSH